MAEHELEKLLGGFAADTLTPEERQKLFTAALQDQQLFNALADEQALKELLTDPTVRRRLLDVLQQTSPSRAGGSVSWLDWFHRPAGLALAGGLAAAIFAVVLGTKIYQESLKQSVRSIATEDAKPAAPTPSASQPAPPSLSEPRPTTKLTEEQAKESARKEVFLDRAGKRTRPARPSPAQEQHGTKSSPNRETMQRTEQDEFRKQADPPVASLNKTAEDIPALPDQKLGAGGVPPAAPTEVSPMDAPVPSPLTGVATSSSARALFYDGGAARLDAPAATGMKGPAMESRAKSTPQADRVEKKTERLATPGKAAGSTAQLKPLGLRYSFMIRGSDGQEQEVDAITASKSLELVRLTVKTNQDAHLQVWTTAPSSKPQLLFPNRDAGRISLKVYADTREDISLPTNSGPLTLTLRLSRVPFGPITRQESAMLDRHSANQLTESVTPGSPTGSQERATYVVNQDSTPTAQITVDIPPGR